MSEFQVTLSSEQSESLQKYIYELTSQTIDQVRREAGLSKEWLRKGEAADFIGISSNTLSQWVEDGLKVSIVNGVQLISKAEISRFLIEHQL
ncbi:DNA-binding protein [Enterococcus dispar]|jgi:DNA-binding transcriptional regulator YiaG|uniref:DNA-binding protein n=1 Tax=Enterococcus dispar TaxID=44009 RepID=UPI00232FA309|nr:DNA-binding protein [Enterococcus dispar]WCG32623.1 DNA-binding protein [Enterococcus dispar]